MVSFVAFPERRKSSLEKCLLPKIMPMLCQSSSISMHGSEKCHRILETMSLSQDCLSFSYGVSARNGTFYEIGTLVKDIKAFK